MACNEEAESETSVTFFWIIENYSYFNDYFHILYSPDFYVNSIRWNIALYPCCDIEENIILYNVYGHGKSHMLDLVTEYDFANLAEDGSVLQISEIEMYSFNPLVEDPSTKLPITKRAANLSRDTLRLRCKVRWPDRKDVEPATFFARIVLGVKKRNFLWDIKKFSSLGPGRKCTYAMSHVEKNELTLKIQVNEEDKIMIFIESLRKEMKCLKFQSFIIDTNGCKVDCGKSEKSSFNFEKNAICTLPFTKKFLMQYQHLYLKNDVLSLSVANVLGVTNLLQWKKLKESILGFLHPALVMLVLNHICHPPNYQFNKMLDLKEDMKCLYDEGAFSDVKIRTNTQTFHAHKAILSARSLVFRAMLMTDMKEKIQESVDVPDLEDDTVRQMLLYVYTNALEGLQWESALRLYVAADKYQIISLKSKCRSFLQCNLCPKNLCEGLVLADMHGDGVLKEAAQNYILSHEKDVFGSDKWKLFTKNNTALAAETMLLIWERKN
ncbi:TD and POZ domain-containing protein 3 [Trichonephila clavata]|uniref:TD and POZ domain-containing protein 3 n=1 Tax=Trichonephila clavata TaxID=2740835 RepID=A0A8X6GHR5_TRICU|nr:TD and POZ domain-containing protein 3 [Trichonephila clavata]